MAPAGSVLELSIFQIAIVVRDLDAAAAGHTALVGNGPWRVYEFGPHTMSRYEMRGRPATAHTLVALNDSRPRSRSSSPCPVRASTRIGWTSAARACTTSPQSWSRSTTSPAQQRPTASR